MIQRRFCNRESMAPAPLCARLSLKQFLPGWSLSALDEVPDTMELPPDVCAAPVPLAVAVVIAVGLPTGAVTVGAIVSVTVTVGIMPGVVVSVGVAPGVIVLVGVAVSVTVGVGVATTVGVSVGTVVGIGVVIAVGVAVAVGIPTGNVGGGVFKAITVTPGVGVLCR